MIPSKSPTRTELQLRFRICVAVAVFVFAVLGVRLFYLQIVKGLTYRYQSENNRIRAERLPPPRGLLLDRNGETLADIRPAFDARMVPADIPKDRASLLYTEVGRILDLPASKIADLASDRRSPKWRPRLLKRHISWEQMARLEARRIELPGFYVSQNPVRFYPFADSMSATLGYLGPITESELDLPEFFDYDMEDWVGRAGVERAWESRLRGTPGGEQVQVDVLGQRLGTLVKRSAKPGMNLVLTIDRRIQEAAEVALGENVGSLVAIHIPTGEVLAMVSHPSYDANIMAGGISVADWNALITDPNHPLQNRPVQGVYAPGSTFKIMMALAGLEKGAVTPQTTVTCTGHFPFGGHDFKCWNRRGHGTVNLSQALEQSCDVYFYKLGLELGVDAIRDYANLLGLGVTTGIDLPGEKAGLIPSSEWKRRVRKEPWYAGETLSVSIGQGYDLATPLQLAVMAASVANPQNRRMKPHMVLRVEDVGGHTVETIAPEVAQTFSFKEANLQWVRDGMRRVVMSPQGTAYKSRIDGYTMAGKTGTAQVVGMKKDGTNYTEWKFRDHALFVAYAPYEDPQIAVAVVVDHGGHGGSTAAPVAAAVIATYRDCMDPKFAYIPEEGPPRPEEGPPRSLMTMGFRKAMPVVIEDSGDLEGDNEEETE